MVPVHSRQLQRTPVGRVSVWASPTGIRRLVFSRGPDLPAAGEIDGEGEAPAHLGRAIDELARYFTGEDVTFTAPLDLGDATPFREQVWRALANIAYARTRSYGEVADALGLDPVAARAVGQAIGSNPVPILIPCHRVVASDGRLHGFSGGLEVKARLLRLEGLQVGGEGAQARVRPELLDLGL